MMRQFELLELVTAYKPDADEALINKAYVYAMQKHGSQIRASGDAYFSHPLEVAAILTEMKLDEATIAAGLLHDTLEDTDATRQEIDDLFGESIGRLVQGLTKIKQIDLVKQKAKQGENFRRLLFAVSSDVRVLLVKLADRLHNMRTLGHVREEKQRRIAQETIDIYAPLAGRIGMQLIREELEDLSFRYLYPSAYETTTKKLDELSARHEGLIAEIEESVKRKLAASGISAIVSGRQKRSYSIFRKMERKSISFSQLSDIYGFRVIVDTVEQCYVSLGAIHSSWQTVPGRFKDYISTPKRNDYQSIHTTVIGPKNQRAELQIRTHAMHGVAEQGVAAHTLYKDTDPDGVGNDQSVLHRLEDSNAYTNLKNTIELLSIGHPPEDFLEHTKLELFLDQVYCFTPRGLLISLPRGATAIDFAYAVHTDVGNTCVGCIINGQNQPLRTQLNNGDEVEIVRSDAQTASTAWEAFAITGKARAAIRRSTREAAYARFGELGRNISTRYFARQGKELTRTILESVSSAFGQANGDDLLAALGRGEIQPSEIFNAVYPDFEMTLPSQEAPKFDDSWFEIPDAGGLRFNIPDSNESDDVAMLAPIRGLLAGTQVNFDAYGAVPGDRIVAIMGDDGTGVTIYPIHAKKLAEFEDEPERWLDVRWDFSVTGDKGFPAKIGLWMLNEPGSLGEIATMIGKAGSNIENVKMNLQGADYHQTTIDLKVRDLKHLTSIITQLRAQPIVSDVKRLEG